jgi:hypothetical protein
MVSAQSISQSQTKSLKYKKENTDKTIKSSKYPSTATKIEFTSLLSDISFS